MTRFGKDRGGASEIGTSSGATNWFVFLLRCRNLSRFYFKGSREKIIIIIILLKNYATAKIQAALYGILQ